MINQLKLTLLAIFQRSNMRKRSEHGTGYYAGWPNYCDCKRQSTRNLHVRENFAI